MPWEDEGRDRRAETHAIVCQGGVPLAEELDPPLLLLGHRGVDIVILANFLYLKKLILHIMII